MPSKKKSPAKSKAAPASAEDIRSDIHKALADARSKLKASKGGNIDTKLKLLDNCKRIIDDIWPC
jgi:hypothetical protein